MARSSPSPEQRGLAGRHLIEAPDDVAAAGWLTPWAAEFRYDDEPLHSLDRGIALEIAGEAVAWCEKLLAETQAEEEEEEEEEEEDEEAGRGQTGR